MSRKRQDKMAKIRSSLEGLGQSMDALGKGLRERRAREKSKKAHAPKGESEASFPTPPSPRPAAPSAPLSPLAEAPAPTASMPPGAESSEPGLVALVADALVDPRSNVVEPTSSGSSSSPDSIVAQEDPERGVQAEAGEEALPQEEVPKLPAQPGRPTEPPAIDALPSQPLVPVADPSLAPTSLDSDGGVVSSKGPSLPPAPDFAVVGKTPLRPLAPPSAEDSLATAWLADLDLETELSVEVVSEEEADVREDESIEDRLDPEFAATVQQETEELIPAIETSLQRVAQYGNGKDVAELGRYVHTLKGVAGIAGAMKTRALIHRMETLMEEVQDGRVLDKSLHARLSDMFALVRQQMESLFRSSSPVPSPDSMPDSSTSEPSPPPVAKSVRIPALTIDQLFNEINEARLAGTSLAGSNITMRRKLREMDENIGRVSRMIRDLEMQAETQIQSRRAQLAENNEEFDPLELDRFTVLQELSRLVSEAVSDVQDLHRDLARAVSDQETHLAYQERSIHEVQEGLLKTRLVTVDTVLNDRLHKVALSAAKELGKSVNFVLSGGRVALDRAMLERVIPPLEHLLRNSVAHGIEAPEQRRKLGKSVAGLIRVAVRQEAGRVILVVEDDGSGLNVDRIRQKAVERGLWEESTPMSDAHAADMICRPGFSTAEAVSQVAGRGVGMDVVRSDVLAMGGRFDLATRAGRGLRVVIQLPTTVASASVMVVQAEGETWAIPTEMIDDVMVARGDILAQARLTGEIEVGGQVLPFSDLGTLMGVSDAASVRQDSAPLLLLSEGTRRVAVETYKLRQVAEVPLRPLGRVWSAVPGIVGSTLLPDGRASFLVDPLRVPWVHRQPGEAKASAPVQANRPPLVLVVDDSITVRKVTAQFLERNGFEPVLAKDGQEALEVLAQIQPAAMLLDVEMPRMDGFDCAKNIRENPRHANLPILMITSRTASKHRDRAFSVGVDEYLGKPFHEDELLELLTRYVAQGRSVNNT